ncbi:MAG: hypothetical protein Q8K86_09625 [Candidatus Nanopelagicaceae bacterium]|nr:hypothetical protein [Candidatus Nanopelagicaceae bacterium]
MIHEKIGRYIEKKIRKACPNITIDRDKVGEPGLTHLECFWQSDVGIATLEEIFVRDKKITIIIAMTTCMKGDFTQVAFDMEVVNVDEVCSVLIEHLTVLDDLRLKMGKNQRRNVRRLRKLRREFEKKEGAG